MLHFWMAALWFAAVSLQPLSQGSACSAALLLLPVLLPVSPCPSFPRRAAAGIHTLGASPGLPAPPLQCRGQGLVVAPSSAEARCATAPTRLP